MTDRVLDLSERPASLSVRNSLLLVRFEGEGQLTVPLAELAVVVASHPQIRYTQAVLAGLAAAGSVFVACDEKHMPAAMLLPLKTHSLQTERFAEQAQLPRPKRKRLWQQIVRAKILSQARVLAERTGNEYGLPLLASRVRSGDPANCEAQAARIYWPRLFSDRAFRRSDAESGANACLNYAYAVLRAVVARALCAAGLHPSLPLHHHNRYDPFCLADDLMEPYRPLVDRMVVQLWDDRQHEPHLDKEAKKALLEGLLGRFNAAGESRMLFDWVARAAFSLAAVIEGQKAKLEIAPL
jgi:CRISPR-associated protein Cas1